VAFSLNLIAEYRVIFPEGNETVEQLIPGIPKDIFLKAATTFLGKEAIDEEWRITLRNWFRLANQVYFEFVSSCSKHYLITMKTYCLSEAKCWFSRISFPKMKAKDFSIIW
jgi:hypothetical protein